MPEESPLVVVNQDPFNAEAPLALLDDVITPTPLFYVRSHFSVPRIDPAEYRVAVEGAVERPLEFTLSAIQALPVRTLVATLECAGNGRVALSPPVEGEQWAYGAVSTATWTGVSLGEVLDMAGIHEGVREILFVGADSGDVPAAGGHIEFERSLPIEKAMHEDTLLVWAMNGEPLTPAHGMPLRLIVPGWYGMASVKWLTRIEAIVHPFRGFYQHDRYVLDYPDSTETFPLHDMNVRSVIVEPVPDTRVPRGDCAIRGFAWSGEVPVRSVEVRIGEEAWQPAQLTSEARPYSWLGWSLQWRADRGGGVTLRSRAVDAAGNTQPDQARWNRHGYGNNAIQKIQVTVEERIQ